MMAGFDLSKEKQDGLRATEISPQSTRFDANAASLQIANGANVAIKNIRKYYGDVHAVDSVSLDIRAGEFVSLLGPSGSGKTTLLMMIAGFELPSGGAIRIADRDVTHVPPNKRGLGMVFQRYALFPHMNVAKNVAYPLHRRNYPKHDIDRKVAEALRLVSLDTYGARMPNQLSGGQQQRVAVARALVFEPPVLLMDEPLGALDKKLREQMQLEIKKLQKALGVTVLYVTHDQEEALTMSDRVAVMNEGRLVQIGNPQELYDRPASPFVADFIGKMNFFKAQCRDLKPSVISIGVEDGSTLSVPAERLRGTRPITRGANVLVASRPERTRLAAAGQGGPNSVPGIVEAAIFVGSFRLYVVRSHAGAKLNIQMAPDAPTQNFEEGATVDIVLDPAHLHVFPEVEA